MSTNINAITPEWAIEGDFGKTDMVNVKDLLIDDQYQRGQVSLINTQQIAKQLDWTAFGMLTVLQRSNGLLFVVDGHQRLLAAKMVGAQLVPCMIFMSDGPEHEAMVFHTINTRRRSVGAYAKFKAHVMAKVEPEASLSRWADQNSFKITNTSMDNNWSINFISILLEGWKLDAESSKQALLVQRKINNENESLNGICHRGLYYLAHNGINLWQHIEKIKSEGGKTAMLRSIRKFCVGADLKSSNGTACGKGLLQLINYKRRNKIVLEGKDE